MSSPRAPAGLGSAGKKLWASVQVDFELSGHEEMLLEEACRCRDRIGELRARVDADGLMIPSSQGMRLNPCVVESRAQTLVLARLLATLKIPGLPEDVLPPVRSVYGLRAVR